MAGGTRRSFTALVASAAAMAFASAAPATAAEPDHGVAAASDTSWQLRLIQGDSTRVNVAVSGGAVRIRDTDERFASAAGGTLGTVTYDPRSLDRSVNRIRASVAADVPAGTSVVTDVRGRTARGWSEWTSTSADSPAILPERVTQVQVRLTLRADRGGPSPVVTGVRLAGDSVPTTAHASRATPRTYNVFATREGLVGKKTANGHTIEERDHFVALPSTRSLSPDGTGDYSVQVCAPDTGRCAFAPVWDVGPWNVHDDYWNPPSVRQKWSDLPQGTPEAEAAYRDGYNGGRDGSGRVVRNPAGIDLADGMFWDALGLRDNAWVDVTYLWTGGFPATAAVGGDGGPVRLHAAPSTSSAVVGLAGRHATVPVYCQARGERTSGYYGTSDVWHRVGPDMFIPAASTSTDADTTAAPRC